MRDAGGDASDGGQALAGEGLFLGVAEGVEHPVERDADPIELVGVETADARLPLSERHPRCYAGQRGERAREVSPEAARRERAETEENERADQRPEEQATTGADRACLRFLGAGGEGGGDVIRLARHLVHEPRRDVVGEVHRVVVVALDRGDDLGGEHPRDLATDGDRTTETATTVFVDVREKLVRCLVEAAREGVVRGDVTLVPEQHGVCLLKILLARIATERRRATRRAPEVLSVERGALVRRRSSTRERSGEDGDARRDGEERGDASPQMEVAVVGHRAPVAP